MSTQRRARQNVVPARQIAADYDLAVDIFDAARESAAFQLHPGFDTKPKSVFDVPILNPKPQVAAAVVVFDLFDEVVRIGGVFHWRDLSE